MHIKRVLLPIKGQRVDNHALEFACDLVRHEHGAVCLLGVIEVPREYAVDAELPVEVAACEALLRTGERYVKSRKVKAEAELLQARDSGPAVVQEARERGVDAIVLGIPFGRRHAPLQSHGDAAFILEHADCPVLLYREREPDASATPAGAPSAGAGT